MSYKDTSLHIAMYPWFAMGHLTQYLNLANKLAQKGHKISYFIPVKTQQKFTTLNLHPNLLTFYPIIIPPVDGLAHGAETMNDVHGSDLPKIMAARDLTKDALDTFLAQLKPDFLLFDSPEWVPSLAKKHGAKSIYYATQYLTIFAYCNFQARNLPSNHRLNEGDLIEPPPGFPTSLIRLHAHEARVMANVFSSEFENGLTFIEKQGLDTDECVAILFKSCREMEGIYGEFLEKHLGKRVLLAGFVVPETPTSKLDRYFDSWFNGFSYGSVIYCALGSECILGKEQFDELVLGLELTGMPFLAALKPPIGYKTIESALPKGFTERTKGRGIVYGEWVQQQLILQHPSVGCFVTHCGPGSLSEGLMGDCQLVMMPQSVDQFVNARLISMDMKVGVEIEKREHDGFIHREAIGKAVEMVMDVESEVGRELKANRAKWRELLFKEGLEESYINNLIQNLRELL